MNTKNILKTGSVILVLAAMVSLSWAQAGPGNGQGRGQGQGCEQGNCQGGGGNAKGPGRSQGCEKGGECLLPLVGPMDEKTLIEKKLAIAIDDEYHAMAIYADVLEQFGDVRPFSNIINAEQHHIDALGLLYDKYDLAAPGDSYTDDTFTFGSLKEAAQASVDAEIANADLYDDLLIGVSDPDVIKVFEKLQWASRERHLTAFQRYVDGAGQGGGKGKGKGRGHRGGGNGQGKWRN